MVSWFPMFCRTRLFKSWVFVFITITISFSCDSFLYFVHLTSSWTFIDLSEFLRGKTLLYFLVQSTSFYFNYTWTLTFVHRIMSINTILFIQPAGKIKNRQSRNIHKKTSFKMPKWPSDQFFAEQDYLIPEFFVFITITISFSCDSFLYFVHLMSSKNNAKKTIQRKQIK
jgi:hypothetical protein